MTMKKICEECPDYCKECIEDNQVKYVLSVYKIGDHISSRSYYGFTSLESLADFVINMDHCVYLIVESFTLDAVDFIEPWE